MSRAPRPIPEFMRPAPTAEDFNVSSDDQSAFDKVELLLVTEKTTRQPEIDAVRVEMSTPHLVGQYNKLTKRLNNLLAPSPLQLLSQGLITDREYLGHQRVSNFKDALARFERTAELVEELQCIQERFTIDNKPFSKELLLEAVDLLEITSNIRCIALN